MVSKHDGVAQLERVPLFESLTQRQRKRLWESMKIVEHSTGHVIMTEGRSGLGFQMILSGEVEVERKGKKVTLGPGSFFGEMSLIDGGLRTATVTASTPVVAAALNSSSFKVMVMNQPDVMWKILVHLSGRLRDEQSVASNLSA